MKSTLIDIKETALLLHLTPQQVRNLCRSAKLRAFRTGGNWLLYKSDVMAYYDVNSCGVAEDRVAYHTGGENDEKGNPIALSFFSGAMGLDIGLERAGFKVLLTCETDNACRKTIVKNHPDIALIGDICKYDAPSIKQTAGLKPTDNIDLVIGGPPCQTFSTAGKRQGFQDSRGNLLLRFVHLILDLEPSFAVIENVRGILSAPLRLKPEESIDSSDSTQIIEESGRVLTYILNLLSSKGYGISFNLYNSANFGTPQIRERVIIICSRDGNKLPYLTPTHSKTGEFGLPYWRTFYDATKDLKAGNHHLNFPEKRLKYYRLLCAGEHWRHLPEHLQKEALGKSYFANGGKTGFFRRLSWNEPAPTLVTHPAMPATDLAHPVEDRPLSIEEYRRLQEFPDDWIIEGTIIEQYRQIGNAVPVSLGQAIGTLLIKYMRNEQIPEYPSFKYSRYLHTNDTSWQANIDNKRKSEQFLMV